MCFTHDEIIAHMIETVEQLSIACSSRAKPHIEDDEYEFVTDALDRWSDRKFPKEENGLSPMSNSKHIQLEQLANRILEAA